MGLAIAMQIIGFLGFCLAPMSAPILWCMVCGAGLGESFAFIMVIALEHLPNLRRADTLAAFVQGFGFILAACKDMGSSCVFSIKSWLRAQWEIDNGHFDGVFPIGWSEERSKNLYFSPPMLKTEYGFFVRKDNPLIFKQESDVKGYRVGVYGPSNTEPSLLQIKERISHLDDSATNDDERQFKRLSQGKIQAVYSNRDVGFYLIKN